MKVHYYIDYTTKQIVLNRRIYMEINVKVNYIVFAAITMMVAFLGKFFSSSGMQWYYTLKLPSYTPAGWFISLMWILIYVATSIAVAIVWNTFKRDVCFVLIMALFAINALCNTLWTYFFFYKHSICMAFADILVLIATLIALMLLTVRESKLVAGLLIPYLAWVLVATWLNAMIMIMN